MTTFKIFIDIDDEDAEAMDINMERVREFLTEEFEGIANILKDDFDGEVGVDWGYFEN